MIGRHTEYVSGGGPESMDKPKAELLSKVVGLHPYQPDDEVTLFSNCLDGEGNDKDCRFFFA